MIICTVDDVLNLTECWCLIITHLVAELVLVICWYRSGLALLQLDTDFFLTPDSQAESGSDLSSYSAVKAEEEHYTMEAVISVVMKFCGSEMDAYGECVSQNPGDWLSKCNELKQKAADCSSNHPAVKKINKECAKEYIVYNDCLNRNPEEVTVCVEALHKFMNCASQSAARIQKAYKTKDYEPNPTKPST